MFCKIRLQFFENIFCDGSGRLNFPTINEELHEIKTHPTISMEPNIDDLIHEIFYPPMISWIENIQNKYLFLNSSNYMNVSKNWIDVFNVWKN